LALLPELRFLLIVSRIAYVALAFPMKGSGPFTSPLFYNRRFCYLLVDYADF
jgi:hypothetical protein